MTLDEFIEEWIQLSVPQVPIIIDSLEDVNKICISPNLETISIHRDWSYSINCLFYKNIPYCYKVNRMFIVNMTCHKDYRKVLQTAFANTSSRCYLFEDFNFHPIIYRSLYHFKQKIPWIDNVLVQAILDLHIVFCDPAVNQYIKEKINYWENMGVQFEM